jgi:uncharacterized ubiquitin-like protein YukD
MMPDNTSMRLADNSAVINEVSLYVYQSILEIQQKQPELLGEKYRNIPWGDARNQSAFLAKLKEKLSKAQNQEALILSVEKSLQILVIPSYFELPFFNNLMEKIRSSIQQLTEASNLVKIEPLQQSLSLTSGASAEHLKGIAILLLDAENLQLDANTEKFLAKVCTYPIQIKVAFANWRSLGKQDSEFHGRGYELIHVPAGKDSADVKMATVGSSIFIHYPTAREVLVCSSDTVMTHLCNTLQTHGLTVYLVRKQGDNITVFNSKTSLTQTHSLKPTLEIPTLEQFIVQLKELIKAEQERTNNQWIKLARLSKLFQENYKLTISQVVSSHLPGKRARDIFIENSANFVVHQLSDQAEFYINLFEISSTSLNAIHDSTQPLQTETQSKASIKISSSSDLEQVLVKLINTLTTQLPGSYIPINTLGTEFQQYYGQSVTTVIKKLQLNCNFIKFLQSSSAFKLQQGKKGWQVAIA